MRGKFLQQTITSEDPKSAKFPGSRVSFGGPVPRVTDTHERPVLGFAWARRVVEDHFLPLPAVQRDRHLEMLNNKHKYSCSTQEIYREMQSRKLLWM